MAKIFLLVLALLNGESVEKPVIEIISSQKAKISAKK